MTEVFTTQDFRRTIGSLKKAVPTKFKRAKINSEACPGLFEVKKNLNRIDIYSTFFSTLLEIFIQTQLEYEITRLKFLDNRNF